MTGDLFDFQTNRSTLLEALRLSATTLREASFPEAEFAQLKREWLTGLQAKLSDPGELSRDALQKHFDTYPAGDPRHYLSLQGAHRRGQLRSRWTRCKAFYEQFWGTARGEIAIVGDFDAAAAEKEIERAVCLLALQGAICGDSARTAGRYRPRASSSIRPTRRTRSIARASGWICATTIRTRRR
jgi:zinc protease